MSNLKANKEIIQALLPFLENDFEEEVVLINKKESKLSRTKRDLVMGIYHKLKEEAKK